MSLASLDGVIGPPDETRIPVTDEGLLRGDGAFEVARLYGGVPFAMEDHYIRLERTCNGLRLEPDWAALRAEVTALLEAAGPIEALLRVVLTRGGARILIIEPLPERLEAARVATITYAPSRVLDDLKTLSYAGNMLAIRLAKERGFDDALFITPHGRIIEGATWSFFWVQDGELLTPPLEDHILQSITRARVIEESEVREAVCTLEEVRGAQEAFISSSLREVTPISVVDDIALPSAPGPVTTRAAQALTRRIERELTEARAALARA